MLTSAFRLVCLSAAIVILLASCATPPPPMSSPTTAATTPTTSGAAIAYESVRSIRLPESVAASALSPDGIFALLSYKGVAGDNPVTIHRFDFEDGDSRSLRVVAGSDGVMFRAVSEAKAIAISEDGQTFLANWPAYLARIDSKSGEIESLTSISEAGYGMTSFNVLEFDPSHSVAYGLGSTLIRFDMRDDGLPYRRNRDAPGGRSLVVLAPDRVGIANSEAAKIIRAGASSPVCTVDGAFTALEGSPDGSKLVGASMDRETSSTSIVVWSSTDCSELQRWAPGARTVFDLEWLPDGATIASAENDGQLRFWNSSTGELKSSMAVEDGIGFQMHFSQDASRLLTRTMWGNIHLRFYQRR